MDLHLQIQRLSIDSFQISGISMPCKLPFLLRMHAYSMEHWCLERTGLVFWVDLQLQIERLNLQRLRFRYCKQFCSLHIS